MDKYYKKRISFRPLRLVFSGAEKLEPAQSGAPEAREGASENSDDLLRKGLEAKQKEYEEARTKFSTKLNEMAKDDSKPHLQKLAGEYLFTLGAGNLISEVKDLLPDNSDVAEKIGKIGEAIKDLNAWMDTFKESASEKTALDKKHKDYQEKKDLVEGRVNRIFSSNRATSPQLTDLAHFKTQIKAMEDFDFVNNPALYESSNTTLDNINKKLQENFKPLLWAEFSEKYFNSEALKNYREKVGQRYNKLKDDPVLGGTYSEAGTAMQNLFENARDSFMAYGFDESVVTTETEAILQHFDKQAETALTEEIYGHPLMGEIGANGNGELADIGSEYESRALDLVDKAKTEGSEWLNAELDALQVEYISVVDKEAGKKDLEQANEYKDKVSEYSKKASEYKEAVDAYNGGVAKDPFDAIAVAGQKIAAQKAAGEMTVTGAETGVLRAKVALTVSSEDGKEVVSDSDTEFKKAGKVVLDTMALFAQTAALEAQRAGGAQGPGNGPEAQKEAPGNLKDAEGLLAEESDDTPELREVKNRYVEELKKISEGTDTKEQKEKAVDRLMTQYKLEVVAKGFDTQEKQKEYCKQLAERAKKTYEDLKGTITKRIEENKKNLEAEKAKTPPDTIKMTEFENQISVDEESLPGIDFNLKVLEQLDRDAYKEYPLNKRAIVLAHMLDAAIENTNKDLHERLGDEAYKKLFEINGKPDTWGENWDNGDNVPDGEAPEHAAFFEADQRYMAKVSGLMNQNLAMTGKERNFRMPGGMQLRETGTDESMRLVSDQIHYVKSEKGTYVPFVMIEVGEGETAEQGWVALNLLKKGKAEGGGGGGGEKDKKGKEKTPDEVDINADIEAINKGFDTAYARLNSASTLPSYANPFSVAGTPTDGGSGLYEQGVKALREGLTAYIQAYNKYENLGKKVAGLKKGTKVKVSEKYGKILNLGEFTHEGTAKPGTTELTKNNFPAITEFYKEGDSPFKRCQEILAKRRINPATPDGIRGAATAHGFDLRETGWTPPVVPTGKETVKETVGEDTYKTLLGQYDTEVLTPFKKTTDKAVSGYRTVAELTQSIAEEKPGITVPGDVATHVVEVLDGCADAIKAASDLQKEISKYTFDASSKLYDLYNQASKIIHDASVLAGKYEPLYKHINKAEGESSPKKKSDTSAEKKPAEPETNDAEKDKGKFESSEKARDHFAKLLKDKYEVRASGTLDGTALQQLHKQLNGLISDDLVKAADESIRVSLNSTVSTSDHYIDVKKDGNKYTVNLTPENKTALANAFVERNKALLVK